MPTPGSKPTLQIDWDIPSPDFNKVYDLAVGEVFQYTHDVETLMVYIQANLPVTLSEFEVRTISPGTNLYTLYGPNACIVTVSTPAT